MRTSALKPASSSLRMNTIGAALVLLLAGTVLMLIQWVDIRREYIADAEAQARVIASSSAAAVMFGDAEGARETLAPLASLPAVRRAALRDKHSNLIASYPGSAGDDPAATAAPCASTGNRSPALTGRRFGGCGRGVPHGGAHRRARGAAATRTIERTRDPASLLQTKDALLAQLDTEPSGPSQIVRPGAVVPWRARCIRACTPLGGCPPAASDE